MAHTATTCIYALRRVSALLGELAGFPHQRGPVRITDYTRLRRRDEPSWQTVLFHLDTWNKACIAAGLPTTREGRHTRGQYTSDEVLDALVSYLMENGPTATAEAYIPWARERPRTPGLATVLKHHRTWRQARAAALASGAARASDRDSIPAR